MFFIKAHCVTESGDSPARVSIGDVNFEVKIYYFVLFLFNKFPLFAFFCPFILFFLCSFLSITPINYLLRSKKKRITFFGFVYAKNQMKMS